MASGLTPRMIEAPVVRLSKAAVAQSGLIRRTWRIKPDCATAAFDNLTTGASIIRGVKPEAILTFDGVETPVGGLLGQPDYAYLLPQWLDSLSADPKALHCTGWERAPVEPRFGWK